MKRSEMEITSTALLAELLEYGDHEGWCRTQSDNGGEPEGGPWTECECGWAEARARIREHLKANAGIERPIGSPLALTRLAIAQSVERDSRGDGGCVHDLPWHDTKKEQHENTKKKDS